MKRQLRSPVFWIPPLVALLMVTGAAVTRLTPWMPRVHSAHPQQLAVPSYFDPAFDPQAWSSLARSTPGRVGVVVANVMVSENLLPQPAWVAALGEVRANGIEVVGYVDTGYLGLTGVRTRAGSTDLTAWIRQIGADVDSWYAAYGSQLSGIFFDRGQSACGPAQGSNEWADRYRGLRDTVMRVHPGALTILNPGTAVPRCFDTAADTLVTFEGSYGSYVGDPGAANRFATMSWTPTDPKKLWHIVYGATDTKMMERVLALGKTRAAGYIYVTDDALPNPYDTLPMAYWEAELRAAAYGPQRSGGPVAVGTSTRNRRIPVEGGSHRWRREAFVRRCGRPLRTLASSVPHG